MLKVDWQAFGQSFFEHYARSGYGRLPKRDIDVLVMHLLMQHGALDGSSDWDLARELRTTPTKVRNLRADARYLYWSQSERDQHVRRCFFAAIANEAYVLKNEQIILSVPDAFGRQALMAILREGHHVVDTSFNGELLRLGPRGFAMLFDALLTEEQRAVLAADPATQALLGTGGLRDHLQAAVVEIGEDGAKALRTTLIRQLAAAAYDASVGELIGILTAVP